MNHFMELFEKTRAAAFYGIPFHHNPTGITYGVETRKAVEHLCKEKGIFCLWDICYQDLRYDGEVNIPIEVSEWGPVLASSFTKTISPGTKCGYLIIPAHYVEHLTHVIVNTRINPNLPTQAFVADFMESGQYERYLGSVRVLYEPRCNALNRALESHFPGAFPVPITGGFFAPLNLESISSDQQTDFIQKAQEEGVGIAPAWDAVAPNFSEAVRKKGFFVRLTFPAYEPDMIQFGISKLKEISERFR